jgi:hypothetical protein
VRTLGAFAVGALAALAGVACGSHSSAPAGSYPAFVPVVPQIANNSGAMLTAAKIVTVTWTADPNEASLEDFGDKVGASSFWTATVGEYGIGPATSGAGNHVRISTPPPTTLVDTDVETLVGQQVAAAATSGWPAYDPQTLYVVYVPAATLVTSNGVDMCPRRSGLHADLPVGSSPHVPYVTIDEHCGGGGLDAVTETASHEIAEAVTNPHSLADRGVVDFDSAHLAWKLFAGPDEEIGDVCESYADAFFPGPSDLPYTLQRLWSNASAAAGHSPCAPHSSEPYYNVAPIDLEQLSVTPGTATAPQAALGYQVGVHATRTFDVGYYSDLPTGNWSIQAVEGDGTTAPASPRLTLSAASGSGKNGDRDTITVTVNADGAPGTGNAILMTIVSSAPGHTTHFMPVLIGAY